MITMFSIAFSLFLLMDAPGNIPLFLYFLQQFPQKKQKKIILRELFIALFIIIAFNFIGEALLSFLNVTPYAVQISGGIILFILSLKMIFPTNENVHPHEVIEEPFIVPLAVPLVAGPAVLAAIMLYSKQQESVWIMMGAIALAWTASFFILYLSPHLSKILGHKGLVAIERLMGLILVMISIQMFLSGLSTYIQIVKDR